MLAASFVSTHMIARILPRSTMVAAISGFVGTPLVIAGYFYEAGSYIPAIALSDPVRPLTRPNCLIGWHKPRVGKQQTEAHASAMVALASRLCGALYPILKIVFDLFVRAHSINKPERAQAIDTARNLGEALCQHTRYAVGEHSRRGDAADSLFRRAEIDLDGRDEVAMSVREPSPEEIAAPHARHGFPSQTAAGD